jgi:putative tricarboxylic transport membrane protein
MGTPGGMETQERHPLTDIIFALAVMLFSAVVYWGTLGLPPPRYEPIGSAALPRGFALVMAFLALIVMLRGFLRWRSWDGGGDSASAHRQRPLLAIAVFMVVVAYVASMDLRLFSFVPASILAFTLIGAMLTGFELRRLPWMAGVVIPLVLLIQLVFQRIFYIDLP